MNDYPCAANIDAFYENEYDLLMDSEDSQELFLDRSGHPVTKVERLFQPFRQFIKGLDVEGGSYLDLGCGKGLAIRAFRDSFPKWDIWGYEISNRYKSFLEKYVKPENLILGPRDLLETLNREFDVISMFDVLEHVSDPISVLKKATRLLKRGGYIYIQVPEIYDGSLDWLIVDHLSHFSLDTIQMLASFCGLKVRRVIDNYSSGGLQMLCQKSEIIPEETIGERRTFVYPIHKAIMDAHLRYWNRFGSKVSELLADAEKKGRPIAIFGTGTAASVIPVYLAESMKWIACFMDENPHRIGKRHFDRPVVGLNAYPKAVDTIFLGIAPQNIKYIVPKLKTAGKSIVWVM
jgi:ubiquinone/menaquinone biosynthesis C-methylase UbiE